MHPILQQRLGRSAQYGVLIIVLTMLAFPIYYMVITSLKPPGEAYRLPPTLWPLNPTVDGYPFVMKAWNYFQTLLNTVLVAGSAAAGATLLGGLAAYGFSRMTFLGKSALYSALVATVAIPGMVTLGPVFIAYNELGLLDTHIGLILIFMSDGIPFAFLTLFAYFRSIPRELDEAAWIDGAGLFSTLFRIIFPIAMPAFAVTFLLLFIAGWNEFLYAFTLTVSPETRLLTVRLFEVPVRADANTTPYDLIAAGGVLILLPLIPLLVRVQKQLVQGILAGAVKG